MTIDTNRILDDEGRTLILRGANLGGGSKNPFGPPGWSMTPESLKNPEAVSFVGRPFPLEEAESHFERLSRAGFTFLRLVITWEALEHAGPGVYDEAYLAYLRKILLIAEQKGVSVFIDPHQDVWSRWTGGDGAPAWTLEKLGINLDAIDECGAAITRQRYSEFHKSRKHPEGEPFPRMIWPSNYNRYAAATMFSLFFGGKTFAPDLQIDGENIQDWLQNRYIAAFRHCYRRLKSCATIAGWGIMNEPHNGFIGNADIRQAISMIPAGPQPSPWDTIQAASGYTVSVPVRTIPLGGRGGKHEVFNPGAISLFKDGYTCPWKQAGVWTDEGGSPRLLKPGHFSLPSNSRQTHFVEDFLKPFMFRFIDKMKEVNENAFFFIEGTPSGIKAAGHPAWKSGEPENTINAFHWYDGFALFTKSFKPWFTISPDDAKLIFGRKNSAAFFTRSLAKGVEWSQQHMRNMPCLLGEFGLAFDMNKRRGITGGDYTLHEEALSMYYDAVDANLLHSTIWNYTADNSSAYGDGWNDEDLSIFSDGKERAAAGWKRPYPKATAGVPLSISWNRKTAVFHYRFKADGSITAPSIIYLPAETFGPNPAIELRTPANIRWEYRFTDQHLLLFNEGYSGETELIVRGYSP
ncbi:MAG TPA: cytoplasm protein [Treponema sp.]|nr:cytoplasm protein [Treponema sp.]